MRRGRARLATPNSKEPTTISSHKLKNLGRFRYAFDICLGTTFLWFLLRYLGDRNPVWAIISFIVVSNPSVEVARPAFLIRITHTLMGCTCRNRFHTYFRGDRFDSASCSHGDSSDLHAPDKEAVQLETCARHSCSRCCIRNSGSLQSDRAGRSSPKNGRSPSEALPQCSSPGSLLDCRAKIPPLSPGTTRKKP